MPATKPSSPLRKHLRASDIRGIAQLATQATVGMTRVVEGVHQSLWSTLGVAGGKAPGQTGGLTGLVYKSIHAVTLLLGSGVEALLARLQPLLESTDGDHLATPQREAVLSALNGVMGDRLAASNSPFAITMSLRYRGAVLNGQSPPAIPEVSAKVLLLIHGLCMNDLHWNTPHQGQRVDHGQTLSAALGYSPVYLRYNSGRHISQNGRELAQQLQELVTYWPRPIEEISVLAHSMGGLVIRSAVHYARQQGFDWPERLKSIVFLGVPHHGAPLERAGNRVDALLGSTPYTAPFARLGHLRSAGITDLRYGYVLDDDWHGHDRFRRQADSHHRLPLPERIACFAVAATRAVRRSPLADRLIGDGLVPLPSALGQHHDPRRSLGFAHAAQLIVYRTNHLGLLSSPEVARQLAHWLQSSAARRDAAASARPIE